MNRTERLKEAKNHFILGLKIIEDLENEKKHISKERIDLVVCGYYNIKMEDIVGRGSTTELKDIRKILTVLYTKYITTNKAQISKYLNRFRSTGCFIIEAANDLMEVDPKFKRTIIEIENLL